MSKRRRRRHSPLATVVVFVCALALAWWAFTPGVGPDLLQLRGKVSWWNDAFTSSGGAQPSGPAAQALAQLPVRTQDPDQRYDRDQFGPAWADVDHNGCDTRNDILKRDLSRPVFKADTHDCVVLSGTLAEPYTGTIIQFQRGQGTSEKVQIDHVVALQNAWISGAWQWDDAKRQQFANDPLNLLAADGQANQDKQAGAADEWLPPDQDFACPYVARQVAVKTKWGLSVTVSERDAIAEVLSHCQGQELPGFDGVTPTPQ